MYTDEAYKRVAKWLGLRKSEDDDLWFVWWEGDGDWIGLEDLGNYFRSPEGRCAIEDKFIEIELMMRCAIGFQLPEPYVIQDAMDCIRGNGPTPAEAWLDAAVRFTEDKK